MSTTLGPYTLIRPIRQGGMGEVWLARRNSDGLVAAVKVLRHGLRGRMMRRGLLTEIRAVAALDHPHIVSLYDHGTVRRDEAKGTPLAPGTPWLAMDFVSGGTLAESMHPSWPQARQWMSELLQALAHAHARGVIHRDLKPANVLFDTEGHVKLTDFGLAYLQERHLDGTEAAPLGGGTAAWMAPEQHARRWVDQGPWTDLYTLGALGWCLLTGQRVFTGPPEKVRAEHLSAEPPPFRARMTLPQGVEGWLRTLLAKRPRDRFDAAAHAHKALRALPAGPARARRPSTPPPGMPTRPHSSPSNASDRPAPRGGLERMRQPRLVGRQAIRSQAMEMVQALQKAGPPQVLVLRGPSGVGKSHLSRWIFERSQELGLAQGLYAAVSTGGLHSLISRHMRWTRESKLEERLSEALDRQGMSDPQEHQDLLDFLAHPQRLARERRHALCMRYLDRVCAKGPTVAWLDDAHENEDILRFALRMSRRATPLPMLMVLTIQEEGLRNPNLLDLLEREGQCTSIRVRSLAPEEQRQLLSESLELAPEAAQMVAETAQGNPLFAVQLVDSWLDRGALRRSPTGLSLRAELQINLPDNLHQVWKERTGRLLRQDLRWTQPLRLAALLGLEVSERDWRAACQVMGMKAPEGLVEALLRARLARQEPQGWSFAHSLLRGSLLRDAEDSVQFAELHRACAAALSHSPARQGAHLLAAGDLEEALEPLLSAAQASLATSEWSQCVRLLQQREQCLNRLQEGPDAPARVEGWLTGCAAHRHLGELDRAEALGARALDAAQRSGRPHAESLAHLNLAAVARERGQLDSASEHVRDAVACARTLVTHSLHARCLFQLGLVQMELRHARKAASHFEDALSLDGRAPWSAMAWLKLAEVALELGLPPLANRALNESRLRARVQAQPYTLAMAELTQGDLMRHLAGRLPRAQALYSDALDAFTRLGSYQAGAAEARLGVTYLLQGRLIDAELHLERALDFGTHSSGRDCGLAHLGLLVIVASRAESLPFAYHLERVIHASPPTRELAMLLPLALNQVTQHPKRRAQLQALLPSDNQQSRA